MIGQGLQQKAIVHVVKGGKKAGESYEKFRKHGRKVMTGEVETRPRGRPRKKWSDACM